MTDYLERENFRKNLNYLMRRNGLQQVDIAKNVGVTQSAVNHWVLGKTTPRNKQLVKIADCLCVTPDMLCKPNNSAHDCMTLDDEINLLSIYRTLSPEGKKLAREKLHELEGDYWYGKENVL